VDPILAFVHEDHCDGCGECLAVCPKSAIVMNESKKAQVVEALCVGCGSCISICPLEALDLHGYTNAQLYAAVAGALERKTDGQRRIIVFADDSCTYRVADAVGIRKMTYSGDVRIIRIPSAGRISPKLIVFAFEKGADGILIGDCPEKSSRYPWSKQKIEETIQSVGIQLRGMGIEENRVVFSEFASGMLTTFVEKVNQLAEILAKYKPVEINQTKHQEN